MTLGDNKYDDARAAARARIAALSADLRTISLAIYNHPEQAFKEVFAAKTVRAYLARQPGVVVADSLATELPTAFVASFVHLSSSAGGSDDRIVVGFCSEYDALPSGHACGHNLICISGIGAFLTTAHLAHTFDISVELKLFGTPGEESMGGKIKMIRAGDFAGVNFAMMLHPGNIDLAYPTYLAAQHLDVEYFGKEAHAAGAPWDGINALDALILAYDGISKLRQQILPTDRVHGVITSGGDAPNIIPAYAAANFMVRSVTQAHLDANLVPRVLACLEAGAAAAGCTYAVHATDPYADVHTNAVMADVYTAELSEQLSVGLPERSVQETISRGSTDMGNVTYEAPGIHCVMDIGVGAAEIHSPEFLAHAKTELAHNMTLDRVGCLVMVAWQMVLDADMRSRARKEFESSV
ncbi:hypothetical protein BC828DRAFT_383568 [Blastocladiella britannica]|nr:hypothetical protein BC828DRAFT_383568 [Blastocladiella britannica]